MSTRYFGTDGIRNRAGIGLLEPDAIVRLGAAIGTAVNETLPEPQPGFEAGSSIIIGRDTRASGPGIVEGLCEGLKARGAFIVDAGVIPTPGLAFVTSRLAANCGIMVSASHNPAADNGIKLFGPAGAKVDEDFELAVEKHYDALAGTAVTDVVAGATGSVQPNPNAAMPYKEALIAFGGGAVSLTGLSIALDCANGAASAVAPEVFERLGCTVHTTNAEPDGDNINRDCGTLSPEGLTAKVKDAGTEIGLGIVLDGDADRVILIDEQGTVRNGDDILYVWSAALQEHGLLANDTVVTTTMANLGLELALADRGVMLARTEVGDKFVVQAMFDFGSVLGGEQSGHICYFGGDDPLYTGDGLATAIAIARLTRDAGKPLSELCEGLTKLPQLIVNVPVRDKPAIADVPGLAARIETTKQRLGERGRVVVRYSGTEPLLRVMIEGEDETLIKEEAQAIGETARSAIGTD